MASVAAQTAVDNIEHVILADYVGVGVGGMFGALPRYVDAVHGSYVHLLADDDVLASRLSVEELELAARDLGNPEVLLVDVIKGGNRYPHQTEPRCGSIDLGCIVTRLDVWRSHVTDYGLRYEGDFDFARALWDSGRHFERAELLFMKGDIRRGAPEVAV